MIEPLKPRVWDISSFILAVADTLAARFSVCSVQGELSSFSKAASGHCYFSLKDTHGGEGLLRCAMFRRAVALLDFVPKEGQQVRVQGRVSVYQPRGELQFVVESMQEAGTEGALMERLMRLKTQLEAEGLFASSRKRPLPAYPSRLGLVTSLGAAALHDVLTSLARRAPHVEMIVYPSLVQGAQAPESIAQAIEIAGRRAEVDALLLCRGGGSLEDLWSFNDERVVRAIVACPLPVVCGIGHETDMTLADFAADLRAATPTAAAEMSAPATSNCLAYLKQLAEQLNRRMNLRLSLCSQRLDHLTLRWIQPGDVVHQQERRLQGLAYRLLNLSACWQDRHHALLRRAHRLHHAQARLIQSEQQRIQALEVRLKAIDPHQVLRRGYAWLRDQSGRPLGSVTDVAAQSALCAVMVDGELHLRVESVQPAAKSGS
ncbi:MAG: exodeoxyribonuclease VII large subunit [Burkholderiales bacterium]